MGRRRQRVCRLLRRAWRAAARPCASGRGRGGAGAGDAGHPLGLIARGRSALGRAGAAAGPVRRARAVHRVRHRGLASGAAARARLHRQTEGGALRRPLPRLARSGRGRLDLALRRLRAGGRFCRARRADDSACRPTTSRPWPRRLQARDDIAAVILEGSGASWGSGAAARRLPRRPARRRRKERGVVMILDEVITGFRWSRGGAQARFNVIPDMCVLAKIVAGGLPGGAVGGRADIMDQLDRPPRRRRGGRRSAIRARSTPTRCARRRRSPRCRSSSARRFAPRPKRPRGHPRRHAADPERGRRAVGHLWRRLGVPHFPESEGPRDRSADLRSAAARLQGAQGRARCQSQPPAAHRDAGERRRHHGRAGRAGVGGARARTRSRARSRRSAPACAGSRPRAISQHDSSRSPASSSSISPRCCRGRSRP